MHKCKELEAKLFECGTNIFRQGKHVKTKSPKYTLSNPAVGETVLTPVKWCCNTGEVPIRIEINDGRTDIR